MKKYKQPSPSKLLFQTQPLIILPELATLVGLNEAIILQQIHYWILANSASGKNFFQGEYWTYNSIKNWQEQFPFWSMDTIRRTLSSLEKRGLIVTGNFNKLKIDRTKWYRIDYQALDLSVNVSGNGHGNLHNPFMQNAQMGGAAS